MHGRGTEYENRFLIFFAFAIHLASYTGYYLCFEWPIIFELTHFLAGSVRLADVLALVHYQIYYRTLGAY